MSKLAGNAAERSSGDVPSAWLCCGSRGENGLSLVAVYEMLKQTRIEFFGIDLSDSAIHYRLRGECEHEAGPPMGPLKESGCGPSH